MGTRRPARARTMLFFVLSGSVALTALLFTDRGFSQGLPSPLPSITVNMTITSPDPGIPGNDLWTYEVTNDQSTPITDFHLNPMGTTNPPEGTPVDPDGAGPNGGPWMAQMGGGQANYYTAVPAAAIAPGATKSFSITVVSTTNSDVAVAEGTKDGDQNNEQNDMVGVAKTTTPD